MKIIIALLVGGIFVAGCGEADIVDVVIVNPPATEVPDAGDDAADAAPICIISDQKDEGCKEP
jgi:hypothetical protein